MPAILSNSLAQKVGYQNPTQKLPVEESQRRARAGNSLGGGSTLAMPGYSTDSRLTPLGQRLQTNPYQQVMAMGGPTDQGGQGIGGGQMGVANRVQAPSMRGVNMQTPPSMGYQSSLMSGSRGFNPLGEAIHNGTQNPGFISTQGVYSAGGDAHMPAGTGTLETAQRIGNYQAQMSNAAPFRGGNATTVMPGAGGSSINWNKPVFRNLQTGELTNYSYATDGQGAFRGGLPQLTGAALAAARRAADPTYGQRPVTAAPAAPAPVPAPAPTPSPVTTTIKDEPIYDQNFIQRLVNQAATASRLDPREAQKRYDIPGLSRDEGQFSQAIPDMVSSRAEANKAMAEIPLQAALANRMHQLEGQTARGKEAIGLANVLRQLQGAQDNEQTAYLNAVLDPLVALLMR